VAEFSHLHLHTQYSLLDGAIRMADLMPKVSSLGMKTVAVTDHGNMFGAVDFYNRAKEHGIKPIFGCETYVAGEDRTDRTNRKNHHLILLARNDVGYKNLTYLNSMGYLEGFYYHPRIDKKLLREHSEGLIGLSACLGSEIAQTLLKQGREKAKEVIAEYASAFEPGMFFLEMMPNGLAEQDIVNGEYAKLGPELGVPLVATNDCHYVERSDARAHEILMCIQQGKTIHDEKRLHHKTDAYYIKSPAEMNQAFHDVPEALENAARIAELCNVKLKLGQTYLPRYKTPEGYDLDSYLAKVAEDGLSARFAEHVRRGVKFDADQYKARLTREIGVIQKMGFSGYFLIVWDFIAHAKSKGIAVGPGRGSGAGSLVAYSMRITDLDPIPYNLLFERFLNPERVSMPDFDVDFCMNRRDEVIHYVTDKYGKNNVGQIVTFHQLKARGMVRDIGRVMALPLPEVDRVAKLVPEPVQGKTPPIAEAIEAEPQLKELYLNNPTYHELLDTAKALEGLNRHAGMHAAGIVISENPLWEYVPCFRGKDGEIITQFAKDEVEKAGLVKFDFLGLKTLTVIETALRLINDARVAKGEPVIDLMEQPLDDAGVYKMMTAGDTTGVFQLESSGFRELLKKLKPDCFEDIVAAVALYRPGPLEGGMVDDFIRRKHGQTKVEYLHPSLEGILKETYGVIVYQEQVMQIASTLSGYSLGQADLLRRAMGKKKAEVMAKEKAGFVAGAVANKVDEKQAAEIFDLMAFFAGYGFNKSHSAAYALITYQTGWLKHHYPVEFMAGLLTCDKDNTDNIVKFIAEARAMGIEVRRPDVNESAADFSVVEVAVAEGAEPATGKAKGKGRGKKADRAAEEVAQAASAMKKVIRFGLGAVKGVGEGAVEAIVAARKQARFTSVYDFCERVDGQKCNKKVLEALVKAGSFDGVSRALLPKPITRAQTFQAIEIAAERAAQSQRDRRSGQTSLFGLLGGGAAAATPPEIYAELEEWNPKTLLGFEKEALGFFITGHPLDRYQGDLARWATCSTADLGDRIQGGTQTLGGIVTDYKERLTKTGNKMAIFKLEDIWGQIEVVVFPKSFEKLGAILKTDEPLLCTGKLEDEGEDGSHAFKMFLDEASPLARLRQEKTSRVHILLNADNSSEAQLQELKALLAAHKGGCTTFLHLKIPKRSETVIPLRGLEVAPSDDFLLRVERLLGERTVLLR